MTVMERTNKPIQWLLTLPHCCSVPLLPLALRAADSTSQPGDRTEVGLARARGDSDMMLDSGN
jgi:hypothetical protein